MATIQIRSQAEVERSLTGIDTTSLAFLIDDLNRANDTLDAESTDLITRQAALQSGGGSAADEELRTEAAHLRAIEGLTPVHGPGVVIVIDATGLGAIDLEDALNNLAAAGAEAMSVNDHRVVSGLAIAEAPSGATIDGNPIPAPWTIFAIGDSNGLSEVANLMTQQLSTDRRVRQATYRVADDVVITAVITERPYVYAVSA